MCPLEAAHRMDARAIDIILKAVIAPVVVWSGVVWSGMEWCGVEWYTVNQDVIML